MPAQQEVWLRGSIEGIPASLQPVAHALLQAKEEVETIMTGFPPGFLWYRPAGLASAGFHLRHLTGVLDRLFTYAEGHLLDEAQLNYLKSEGNESANENISNLVDRFQMQVSKAVESLKSKDPEALYQFRGVGRSQLPSTMAGLLFHAAEHTMRHVGQLLVTARIMKAKAEGKEV